MSRVITRGGVLCALLAAALMVTFGGASPASASNSPLSELPTVVLACDAGVSTLTVAWPVGEYGPWHVNSTFPTNPGSATGTGGIFTEPTTESVVVGNGFAALSGTFNLNRDPVDDASGDNQGHVEVMGEACPFDMGLVASYDCATGTISGSVSQGRINLIRVLDAADNVVATPLSSIFGVVAPSFGPVVVPAGSGTVTVTATGNGGLAASVFVDTDSCIGQLTVHKFYDADVDGVQDATEPPLAGWTFTVSAGGNSVATVVTDNGGNASLTLPAGTYDVTETQRPNWFVTTGSLTQTVVVSSSGQVTAEFGNACNRLSRPGGKTTGFWRNPTGQSRLTSSDFSALNALNLVNSDGTARDFSGTLQARKAALASWLQGASATNMAHLLSAQLAATTLSVRHNYTNTTRLVAPGTTVTQLRTQADAALASDGSTPAGDPNRAAQEQIKNVLESVNNNAEFVVGVSVNPCCG